MMTGFLGTLKPGSQQWSCPACPCLCAPLVGPHLCPCLPTPSHIRSGPRPGHSSGVLQRAVKGGGGNPPHQPRLLSDNARAACSVTPSALRALKKRSHSLPSEFSFYFLNGVQSGRVGVNRGLHLCVVSTPCVECLFFLSASGLGGETIPTVGSALGLWRAIANKYACKSIHVLCNSFLPLNC